METKLAAYHRALLEHATVKRFYERLAADPKFRAALAADAALALAEYRMDVSVDDLRRGRLHRSMIELARLKAEWCEIFYKTDAVPDNPGMRAWRARQIARQRLDLGPLLADNNIHASLAIELSSGCSVGCWFCGLSPEPLDRVLPYNGETSALWRAVLELFRERLGPGVRSGFLYWATDPLDSPDYERFCLDFFEIVGVFPPTTTALALKNVARTRALIELANAHGCWLNRFSVLTVPMLDRIFQEFTAAELAFVECMPFNQEGILAFQNAGRFRDRAIENPALLEVQRGKLRAWQQFSNASKFDETEDYPGNSIACVNGFLVNMVARSVKLISPCTASDRWPLGYLVFDEGTFSSEDELRSILDRLISTHMRTSVRPGSRIRTHDWLTIEQLDDGLAFKGRFNQRVELRDGAATGALHALGELVRAGTMTSAQITRAIEDGFNFAPEATSTFLERMLALGVLDELAADSSPPPDSLGSLRTLDTTC